MCVILNAVKNLAKSLAISLSITSSPSARSVRFAQDDKKDDND